MKADYFVKHSKYLVWDNTIPHYSRRIVKNGKSHYFFPFRKPHKVMRAAFFNVNGFTIMTCDGARAKVTIVKHGNENKIVWVCNWKERPPIGWILNLSPIYMCPFCDAPVAEVEDAAMLSCGFCGGVFSKGDAL